MVKRVTVVHARPGTDRAELLRYWNGVGEVWFEGREEAGRTQATPERNAAMADAATFMGMDRVVAGWAEEHQIA